MEKRDELLVPPTRTNAQQQTSVPNSPAALPIPRVARSRKWSIRLGAMAAALALVGVPAAAASAAKSLPGEPPYGLKRAVEEAGFLLPASPEDRTRGRLELAERRLHELQQLTAQDRAAQPAVEELERATERLRQQLQAVPPEHQLPQGLVTQIQALSEQQGVAVQQLELQHPWGQTVRRLAAQAQALRALAYLHRQPQPGPAGEEQPSDQQGGPGKSPGQPRATPGTGTDGQSHGHAAQQDDADARGPQALWPGPAGTASDTDPGNQKSAQEYLAGRGA